MAVDALDAVATELVGGRDLRPAFPVYVSDEDRCAGNGAALRAEDLSFDIRAPRSLVSYSRVSQESVSLRDDHRSRSRGLRNRECDSIVRLPIPCRPDRLIAAQSRV